MRNIRKAGPPPLPQGLLSVRNLPYLTATIIISARTSLASSATATVARVGRGYTVKFSRQISLQRA
jgi:hypothetical protein